MNRLHGFVTEARADALPEIKAYGQWTRFRDPSFLEQPQLRQLPARVPRRAEAGAREPLGRLRDPEADPLELQDRQGHQGRAARHPVGRRGDPPGAAGGGSPGRAGLQRLRARHRAGAGGEAGGHARRRSSSRPRATAARPGWPPTSTCSASRSTSRTRACSSSREEGQADLSRGRLNAVLVRPIGSPVEPTDRLEYVAMDVSPEEAVAEAWSRRPEVKQVDLEERIRDYAVGIAKAEMPAQPRLQRQLRLVDVRKTSDFFDERLPEVVARASCSRCRSSTACAPRARWRRPRPRGTWWPRTGSPSRTRSASRPRTRSTG